MIKTKQELLNHFSDINEMYNNPFKYQTLSNMIDELLKQQPCEDCISKEKMIKVIERMEKLEEDLYRTEGAESSFATLCLCVEWIKEALE